MRIVALKRFVILFWPLILFLFASVAECKTVQEIAREAFASTVLLVMENEKGDPIAIGSGFFVREGEIASNLHVIQGAARGYARLVGQKAHFKIEGIAAVNVPRDLVVLKVASPHIPSLLLGNSDAIQVGEPIYAVGNPRGLEGTFSQGIISGIRQVDAGKILQITAPLSPGSSGGPILNEQGKVVGVSVAIFHGGQNLNFAIPSNDLKAMLEKSGPIRPLSQWAPSGAQAAKTGEVLSGPDDLKMEFVYISPGAFVMGAPEHEEGRWDREGPPHPVTIRNGFYLGKYAVTQGQWEAVMGTRPWLGRDRVGLGPDHPAVYVSWEDAQAFIRKLNQAAGHLLYRLPTEAEWEYACRAGTATRWSFGEDEGLLGDYAWYRKNAWDAGLQYAQPVGIKKPNPWGLYDMHGNVFEWVQDWYGPYTEGAKGDPTGPAHGSFRVTRGGHFDISSQYVRSASRGYLAPSDKGNRLGFRVVRIE